MAPVTPHGYLGLSQLERSSGGRAQEGHRRPGNAWPGKGKMKGWGGGHNAIQISGGLSCRRVGSSPCLFCGHTWQETEQKNKGWGAAGPFQVAHVK